MARRVRMMEGKLEDCPFYMVTRASLVMTAAFKKSFSGAGIGKIRPPYLVVMWCLWEQEGMKMSELARCAGLEPSTMTGLLDRMERDEYVIREPDPDDRRAHKIFLTDKGRAEKDTVARMVDETLGLLFAGISDDEIDTANDVLRRVMKNARGAEQ